MVFGFTSLWANAGVFLLAAAVIGVVGPRLSRAADSVGSVTGLGQTLAGALLLGASTSLPGLIVSFQTAFEGRANLAAANSLGGIAAQTLFIALADVALRSDTLEHEDTLTASLMQSAVLVSLLTLLLIGMIKANFALHGSFHPISLVVGVGAVLGFWTIQQTRKHPSWRVRESNGDESGGDGDGQSGGDKNRSGSGSGGGNQTNRRKQSSTRGSERSADSDDSNGADGDRGRTVAETHVITVTDRILTVPFRDSVNTERTVTSSTDEDRSQSPSRRETRNESSGRADRQNSGGSSESGQRGDDSSESSHQSNRSRESGSNRQGDQSGSRGKVLRRYAVYLALIATSGYLLSSAAGAIITRTGLSPVVMGLTLTAFATSLPELVTAIASVRRGSVALAIGDIVGGNAFDTIIVALADFAYTEGSIYRAVGSNVLFVASVTILMTGVLTVGFVRRDQKGLANIGTESLLLVLIYVVGVSVVLVGTVVTW